MPEQFENGYLHRPAGQVRAALALTHGAGSNCNAPLLIAVADQLAAQGWAVYRFDLPFRCKRPHGPPHPSGAQQDREGIREAAQSMRTLFAGRAILGGHSYGGRQASMAAAEDPQLADGLVLLSYPLHPPDHPEKLRTAHFANLQTKAVFVHGSRDPFGTPDEMREALSLIPGATSLHVIQGAGHDLGRPAGKAAGTVAAAAEELLGAG